jgi:hypothetical protein
MKRREYLEQSSTNVRNQNDRGPQKKIAEYKKEIEDEGCRR